MRKTQFILFISLSLATLTHAEEKQDSTASRKSLIVLPYASYQQETSVAPGIAYGYFFKSNNLQKISSVIGNVAYTFRNQFTFNVIPKIFFGSDKWYLYSSLNVKNYPDYYFGLANKPTTIKQAFTSQNMVLLLQPQYIVSKNLLVGLTISARLEKTLTDSTFANNKTAIFKQYGNAGWEPFSEVGLGLVAAFDSRDNQFYPQKGIFAKTFFTVSKVGWGSSYSLQEFSLDFRQYITLFGSHSIAWQIYTDAIFGNEGIPFQLLPTIGGRDLMRGFRQGMYRQNVLMVAQTEYRLPIYNRLKGAVFCSFGDVMNSENYSIDKLKVSYGAGLRYRLNDARAHLRFDVAKSNYNDNVQFYITATEAF
ncbi:MAG: BamA/TamA family outer membrane protein [Paludibacter sp.]